MYNILILGSGGREHCLAWKIKQSPLCNKLITAPGNAGTSECGLNIDADPGDFSQIDTIVAQHDIDFIVVGPEVPLVKGIYDYFLDKDVKVIGPSAAASQLEGSKAFANEFMQEFNIPTAGYLKVTHENIQEGYKYIQAQSSHIVLKADGLAAGKGVLILSDKDKACRELENMLNGKFGKASETVVTEEFLDGIEFSVFVYTDGTDYKLLPEAKDYKRIGEKDTGLNTGGMGAVSPVPFVDDALMAKVRARIIEPTLKGLQSRDMDYKGFIFFGLIKVDDNPFVIEYNCRMGDPETEVVIPRITSDLVSLFKATYEGGLADEPLTVSSDTLATVMLVSGGYPEKYQKGKAIDIKAPLSDNSILFHAGTTHSPDGQLVTNGGRVMTITASGPDHIQAIKTAMSDIARISFENMYYRKDIGFDL